jgi:spore germination protein GerM
MTNLDDRLREAAASLEPNEPPIPPFKGVQQRARRRRAMGAAGAVVVLVAVTLALVSTTQDHDRVIVATPRSTSTTVAPSTTTTTSTPKVPVTFHELNVYLIANEHVVTARRETTGAATPENAVRALLTGPAGATERDLGFTTAIPAGTLLHSVTVDGPIATVDLSQQFVSGGGSLSMQARVAQVVFTVTQFAGIDHVRFRIDGTPVSTIGGEGLMVDNVDRAAFANVTPLILVESPTPDATVGTPLNVRGMSNTFEAGINYTLYDSTGAVLVEGYTTATAGTGTWGTFDFDVAYTVPRAEPGRLTVYELSAKDGSRVHETSVPLELQP